MNYENICLKYMNYEKMKLFAMHELWKYFFAINEL